MMELLQVAVIHEGGLGEAEDGSEDCSAADVSSPAPVDEAPEAAPSSGADAPPAAAVSPSAALPAPPHHQH